MERILIVDDDPFIRKAYSMILAAEGYHIIEADSGTRGIEQVLHLNPHLILTDYKMPTLNGLQFIEKLRELRITTPVIMLTGYGDLSVTIRSIQLGACEFLEKPADAKRLKSVVKSSLESLKVATTLAPIGSIDEPENAYSFGDITLVGSSPPMGTLLKRVAVVSNSNVNVLIEGETGTGKELVAKLIHATSTNNEDPFVVVNCSALTKTIMESELFGHVKGAFTGAVRDKRGKFELAGSGTIFLDEISEISLDVQVKLLRVLQEREFERVGGEKILPMSARVIASTNRNLEELVNEGKFREDLYHRLKVFTISLPPLKERKEDIYNLVIHFIKKYNTRFNKEINMVEESVWTELQQHSWSGNVRELENVIQQAMIVSRNNYLSLADIAISPLNNNKSSGNSDRGVLLSLEEVEREHIATLLNELKGNKSEAARILGVSRPTLNAKIARYNL